MTDLCRIGQRLSLLWNDICVKKNGECTSLYYHISECEECAALRDINNHEDKKT